MLLTKVCRPQTCEQCFSDIVLPNQLAVDLSAMSLLPVQDCINSQDWTSLCPTGVFIVQKGVFPCKWTFVESESVTGPFCCISAQSDLFDTRTTFRQVIVDVFAFSGKCVVEVTYSLASGRCAYYKNGVLFGDPNSLVGFVMRMIVKWRAELECCCFECLELPLTLNKSFQTEPCDVPGNCTPCFPGVIPDSILLDAA